MNGLGPLVTCKDNPDPELAYEAARGGVGTTSMSNGSMMRASPLAVWAQHLTVDELWHAVKSDVTFMHSKVEMTDIVTAYCLAIKLLVKNAD